jgi:hypothetical protein
MKKLLVLSAVVVFVATSCKKDRECVCTDSTTYGGTTHTTVTTIKAKTNKKDAETWCENATKGTVTVDGVAVTGGASTAVCEIK